MGLFSSLKEICFGAPQCDGPCVADARDVSSATLVTVRRRVVRGGGRRCQVESLEPRQMMAANPLVPQVLLGSVYFESATGDDTQPNVIQVSFEGGAAGTTLNRLVINGDKLGDGLTTGDVFFDTEEGGLGAFGHVGLSVVSNPGFQILSKTVVDGGSQIIFTFSGFDAGEKLTLSIDADEAQFVQPGPPTPANVDSNALVEGGEFQRSIMTGEFSAPHFVDLSLEGKFWDAFDSNFASAQTATGQTLKLPDDQYSTSHDFIDRTAGAVAYAPQVPLASISGWVYHDRSDDGVFNTPTEEGIGSVTLELLKDGTPTGRTTTTSNVAGTVGYYEFNDLTPGNYGVREVQPAGWLDGKDTPGDHGGTAADESAGRVDRITGAVLNYGDHGLNYNFGELLPGSIRGTVEAHTTGECDFDNPEIRLSGVQVDLLDKNGQVLKTTFTDANGNYEFTGLNPGEYQVREHQPEGYYQDDERVGTAGGESSDVGNVYSLITGIKLGSGVNATQYDFCEHVGVMLSGNVYHDRDDDGNFDRPGEEGIGSVVVKLLRKLDNGALVDTGLRATTDSNGFYKFNNLEAGTYAVMEVQPAGWLDGKDTPGNLGGMADPSPPGDLINMIMIPWGSMGTEYNFGELLPGSIAGQVQAHGAGECDFDEPERVLSGVTIQLLNASGTVIATTTTDADGRYFFGNLRPGQYAVHEVQPVGYFSDDTRVGSVGGDTDNADNFTHINLPSGVAAVHYDFCEQTPSSISGRVGAHTTGECDFDNPEIVLSGIKIELYDADSHLIATTFTDAQGFYKFDGLAKGTYKVHEIQPAGYFSDDNRVGTVGGVSVDTDTISQIVLPGGTEAIHYDFCEQTPSSIAGQVQAHTTEECNFEDPEIVLSGVTIELYDANDHLIATTKTDANGRYHFDGLAKGVYKVHEIQPSGYFSDDNLVGSVGGESIDTDTIGLIDLPGGTDAIDYDFCEELPGSIRGMVHSSTDGDCDTPEGEVPIEGVQIDLIQDGVVVGTTYTDENGEYVFTGLRPGVYAVREHQPDGYFDIMAHVGDGGGIAVDMNYLGEINVISGHNLTDYDFCEEPPAEIQGYVFIDGAPILTKDPLSPEQIAAVRDGSHTPDDTPLKNVILKLLDGQSGQPILTTSGLVLPGIYSGSEVITTTDEDGFYRFPGLKAGTYAVVEVQPEDLIDGVDTPGHHDGLVLPGDSDHGYAVNPLGLSGLPTPLGASGVVEQFRSEFGDNAIVLIPLPTGQVSHDNNFSEVRTQPPPPFLPPPPPPTPVEKPPVFGFFGPGTPPQLALPWLIPPIKPPDVIGGGAKALGYTWHLSVVNAGEPRSVRLPNTAMFQYVSTDVDVAAWQELEMDEAKWTLARVEGGNVSIQRELLFGSTEGTPVVGDWNGDGIADVGVFIAGRWYIDVNGNGRWDEGDLLAKLGTRDDLPVTGDWDDDGKTDIGIYGPAWPRDPWAIANEPGLPDAANYPSRPAHTPKNVPPTPEVATSGGRVMKKTVKGKTRTDLIDHVFFYGTPGDVPVAGDWNGDGIKDIGVFRDGHWNLDLDGDGRFTDADASFDFGQAGDIPVIGDFNGDGIDEVGVYRNGHWILDTNGNRQIDAHDEVFELGGAADVPVVGDWNGDGTDDPGVYHPGVAIDHISRRAG